MAYYLNDIGMCEDLQWVIMKVLNGCAAREVNYFGGKNLYIKKLYY